MQSYELNTARNCLRIIINVYGIKQIFIPYYICPTVWQACRAEKCQIKFYHIDKNFCPTQNFEQNDYILYPNYFGICSKNVFKLADIYPNLIVDNAHSLFMPHCGLASFVSYRKFLKCSDGAKLYINAKINLPVDEYAYNKTPDNYDSFVKNELRLNKTNPMFINKTSKQIVSQYDLEAEKNRRLNKYYEWDKKLSKTNELNINLSKFDIPFIYPYMSDIPIKTNETILRYWNPIPEYFPEFCFYSKLQPIPLKEHTGNNTYNK